MRNFDFDLGLAPYPEDQFEHWTRLSHFIGKNTIHRIQSSDGNIWSQGALAEFKSKHQPGTKESIDSSGEDLKVSIEERLRSKRVEELQELLERHGIDMSKCRDKEELLAISLATPSLCRELQGTEPEVGSTNRSWEYKIICLLTTAEIQSSLPTKAK